ncbi:hypothetical protein VSAK1_24505 [Vibrio mediterranei AK1]|uniref:hypothetical protein n=1 Tax=Vibrio mediterranei TaxID=689 RepID=UPI0001542C32|nr:hypothetical protein [Vibrio mediterranei]EDL52676.1 hypothetical protein VSAK1_24505 [Vibrio mediterranei AK1]
MSKIYKIRTPRTTTLQSTEENTYNYYYSDISLTAKKLFFILIGNAQYSYLDNNQENDFKIKVSKIKKLFNNSKKGFDFFLEHLNELKSSNKILINSIKINEIEYSIIEHSDLIKPNQDKSKIDTYFNVYDIIKCRSELSLFLTITGSRLRTSKHNYRINIRTIFNIMNLKQSTINERKESKKLIMNILKNDKNGFDFEYKDYCFSYSLKPVEPQEKPEVTAKAEPKPAAAEAVENEPEATDSNETGFNRLIDWQEALKRPEIDFMKESETIFENEKTEEELLDELDF